MEFQQAFVFLAACSILRGSLCAVVKGPSDATELYGNNHELNCETEQTDIPGWDEINEDGSSVEIFAFQDRSSLLEKYSNFNISGTFPVYNLKVTSIEIEDQGIYECAASRLSAARATLSVEAPAVEVTISCDPVQTCPPPDEVVTSEVTCRCTALGAYPNTLELEWTGIEPPTTKPTVTSTSTGRTNSFDFTQEATGNISSTSGSITCTLTNYTRQEAERTAEYEYSSPSCTLEVISYDDMCTTAELNCKCNGGIPDIYTYSFFDGNKSRIDDSETSRITVGIAVGEAFTFFCRGCNGIFGKTSLAEKANIVCTPGTTAIPTTPTEPTTATTTTVTTPIVTTSNPTANNATTTPTMTLMATSTPVKGQGLPLYGIILIVLVCVGVACGTGIAVYCFCCPTPSDDRGRKKGSNTEVGISTANKEKSDKLLYESTGNNFDPPGGADNNTVTASTNETTNSAAPVYGVVNKSTKKKSDNTDGNGVNSKLQSEPDQVEYAAVNKPKPDPQPAPRSSKPPGNNTEPEKMELQYADIDHSNRGRSNEIHQPADAPTEYATVQSVIV